MRRAARVDSNHPVIAEALVWAGAKVTSLAALGNGVPDLLVSYRGRWFVLEVKDGRKSASRRQLTEDQQQWHAAQRAAVAVVCDVQEALAAIGAKSTEWRSALREDAA